MSVLTPVTPGERAGATDARAASTEAGSAGFSGRAHTTPAAQHLIRRGPSPTSTTPGEGDVSGLRGAARTAWRAVLATAASAVVLQGSVTLGPTPLADFPSALGPAHGPLLLVIGGPPAALAATAPDGGAGSSSSSSSSGTGAGAAAGAAKMERLRQMATPDTASMREVSEELAARDAPAGATTTTPVPPPPAKHFDPKSKLKAPELASLLRIPADTAKSLLSSERELGRLTLGSATASFEAAADLLGLGSKGGGGGSGGKQRAERDIVLAGRLVARQPRVLLVPPAVLRERFAELQSLLAAPTPLARKLFATQPGLLTHTPDALRSRLSALCPLFNVDPSLASELAKHEPGLLAVNAAELSGRAAALGAELQLTQPQLIAVIRRHPKALLSPSAATRSRLRALASLLDVPRGGGGMGKVVLGEPRVVVLGEEEARKNLEALQGLLKVSSERAADMAAEQPSLLVTPGPVLAERLRTLAQLAKVPPAQMRPLVEAKPSLLTKTSSAMRRAVVEAEAEEARKAAEAEEGGGSAGGGGGQRGDGPQGRR